MRRSEWKAILEHARAHAQAFLDGLPERPVAPRADAAAMLAALDRPLADAPGDPRAVIDELVRTVDPGLMAMPSGRFYGWVIGGALPAAVAADWLTTVWDQNTATAAGAPAAAAIEHVALRWIADLLEVPARSGALVTGAQMASFVGLAVARSEVLRAVGWDLDADGLIGAPPVEIMVGAERHNTIDKALRMLGFGTRQLRVVEVDRDGRMRADRLDLAGDAPAIVCVQSGNINGGACDPLPPIMDRVATARARRPIWVHLDGAFGLWARVAPRRRALVDGAELADSWATDAHKWLNTPYDSGIALVRDADAHRRTFRGGAAYLPGDVGGVPNPFDFAPELSRRARGFALWAALRELGRRGVSELVERTCALAGLFAAELAKLPNAEVMNDVVLNQLVVRFGDDAHTRAVLARVQASGECFPTPTIWRGAAAIRISISNWSTDEADIQRSVAAFARANGDG